MLKDTIAALLREVTATSTPITNEAVTDTMRRIQSLCITENVGIEASAYCSSAKKILQAAQERNQHTGISDLTTGSTVGARELPEWKQRQESLLFALQFYGLHTEPVVNGIHVSAGIDASYPVGGTPVQILTRKLPASFDEEVNATTAKHIFEAIGDKLNHFRFADLIKSQSARPSGTVHVPMTRLEFIELVTLLFTNEKHGWKARKTLLSHHNIEEA